MFPQEIVSIASSIKKETGLEVDEGLLLKKLVKYLNKMIKDWKNCKEIQYVNIYKERCVTTGNKVKFKLNNEDVIADALSIDNKFGLVVEMDDKQYVIRSGEASVVPCA